MSSSTASLLTGNLSGYSLDEPMQTILLAAAVEAKGRRHSFLGVEHLLFAILNHENGAGPGHAFLHTLKVDTTALRRSIAAEVGRGAARSAPTPVALRSDSRKVFALANTLRRERGEALIHAGHVAEAMVCDGTGSAMREVSYHLGLERHQLAQLPPRLRRGLHSTGLVLGLAWELPETAEDDLVRSLHLRTWTARAGPGAFLQPGLWDRMECYLYRRRRKLRVLLCPSALATRLGRWFCQRSVIQKSASLAAQPGARRISVPQFFREWPATIEDFAGSLDQDFFSARKPAGQIRLLTEADVPFCRDLYALLEKRQQVPQGHSKALAKWLQDSDTLRLVIECDGSLAGCGGLWLSEYTGNEGTKLPLGGLSFGLIHPRFQRTGFGRTLLAFRMAAMQRMGRSICCVEGTVCSADYLERAGFRFWRTHSDPGAGTLFSGAIVLTLEDAAMLESWLGPERTAILSSLQPPPLRAEEAG